MPAQLQLTFLGTSSAQPSLTRNLSGLALKADGEVWLFDCGEGTQYQFQKTSQVRLGKITRIFITHMHGDHLFGLPGLLCSLGGALGVDEEDENAVVPEVVIVGPAGIRNYIRTSLTASYSCMGYRLRIHELCPAGHMATEGDLLPFEAQGENILPGDDGLWSIPMPDAYWAKSVVAGPLDHRDVPCVGFAVTEASSPGALDAASIRPILMKNKAALAAEGVKNPMALMARIKQGETLTMPDGSVIDPAKAVGPAKAGRKIVILGDTSNSDAMAEACSGCDILVHEATNAKVGEEQKSMEEVRELAICHGHSTPEMAGEFAARVGAKKLLLTHFSARYKGDQSEESKAVMAEIEHLARVVADGAEVIAAYDLMSVDIKRN